MAIELHLQKTTKTPWGFRLVGGAEYEVPLTVIKVTEDSIAQNAGMQEGDVIVRINDIPVSPLTHIQAHDILSSTGNDLILAVRRGDPLHLPPRLLLYETSVDNAEDMAEPIIKPKDNTEETNDSDLNITDEEIVNIIGKQVQIPSPKIIDTNVMKMEETQITNKEVKEEIALVTKNTEVSKITFTEESQKTEERKWSTFLQKPKNPKPKPQAKEPDGPKVQPYRVVIKKQPKKGCEVPKQIYNSETEPDKIEEDSACLERDFDNAADSTETEKTQCSLEQKLNTDEIKIEEEPCANPLQNQLENESTEKEFQNEAENESCESIRSDKCEENGESAIEEEHVEPQLLPGKRLSINLEEQLAQVRQQLQALAQLPSAIQQTLNAVTQQLSEIALANKTEDEEFIVEAKITTQEESTEEYLELSEANEERALSVLEERSNECNSEDTKENLNDDTLENKSDESDEEQALFEELEKQIQEEEERKRQEEIEALKIEEEKSQKKDKERRSSQPRTPLERPIVLPGGRKWSNPDDAVSKTRRPSMTDEKIANTINMFSEVIIGRTMGINFLKYQPPPKNLDHLRNSAVYRLVHDIEPPVRGVVARDGKILAEQDYYVEKQEKEDIPPQMGR